MAGNAAVRTGDRTATEGSVHLLAILFLLAAPLCMASNLVTARWLAGEAPPLGLSFWRWALSALVLLPFVGPGLWRKRALVLRHWKLLFGLGLGGMSIAGGFVYIAVQQTSAVNAGVMVATGPVFILLLAAATLGERLTLRQGIGVVVAIAGALTIASRGDPAALLGLAFHAGDLWALASTLGWAVYSVLLRRKPAELDGLEIFFLASVTGTLGLAPFYLWESLTVGPVPFAPRTLAGLAVIVLVASVASYLLYGRGVAVLGAAKAGPFIYLLPIYGAGLAWALLGEAPQLYHALAAALILGGVSVASMGRRR